VVPAFPIVSKNAAKKANTARSISDAFHKASIMRKRLAMTEAIVRIVFMGHLLFPRAGLIALCPMNIASVFSHTEGGLW